MAHEITRILRAFSTRPWFIEPRAAEQIVSILEFRAEHGPRAEPFREEPAAPPPPLREDEGKIAVLNLRGPIVPRTAAVDDLSGPTMASLEAFQQAFKRAASDPSVQAIVLNIDSPGGSIDLVPETAALIRAARRPDRPIISLANTLAASAAYWIAVAADELVVTPSGEVGSIGVFMLHEDVSEQLEMMGVRMTFIQAGSRKTEGNPFEPLSESAKSAYQATVLHYYDMFVADVARGRGVDEGTVRADPQSNAASFGAGRVYPAAVAVQRRMADRVETLDGLIEGLQQPVTDNRVGQQVSLRRRRLALL